MKKYFISICFSFILILISCKTSIKPNDYIIKQLDLNDRPSYKNYKGEIIIDTSELIYAFSDSIKNLGFVIKKNRGLIGINNKGKELFKVYMYDAGPDPPVFNLFRIIGDHNKIGFANMNGEIIIEPKFNFIGPFSKYGNATFRVFYKDKLVSVSDSEKSKMLLEFRKPSYRPIINQKELFGVINLKGDTVIKPKYNYLTQIDSNIFFVSKDKKIYFIDQNEVKIDNNSSSSILKQEISNKYLNKYKNVKYISETP